MILGLSVSIWSGTVVQRLECSPANSPVAHKHAVRSNGLFVVGPLICVDYGNSLCIFSSRFVYGKKKARVHSLNGTRFTWKPLAYSIHHTAEFIVEYFANGIRFTSDMLISYSTCSDVTL